MTTNRPNQIQPIHLNRVAVIYVRQSTIDQVKKRTGSTEYQRGLRLLALQMGWPENAIIIIDDDLGESGSSVANRRGFDRMLVMVYDDRVGAIFVSDISRFNRNRADFFTLASACREKNVLLVIDGRVVDLDDATDAFMTNIQADVAQYENWIRRGHMLRGALAKARRGHAIRRPPTGYQETEKGRWGKDQDPAVRAFFDRVFLDYLRLGSLVRLLHHYRSNNIMIPVRSRTELRWVQVFATRIHRILTNPAYVGDYAYGRRVMVKGHVRTQSDPQKIIVFPNHHEPYLDRQTWQSVQDLLQRNQPPRAAGNGSALLQGLMVCGKCGRKMAVAYTNHESARMNVTYSCCIGYRNHGEPRCWAVNGQRTDALVARELLQCLTPPAIEAVVSAAGDVNAAFDLLCRQREREIEEARLAERIARRRYEEVHPDNRRVKIALERDYETYLNALHEVEQRHADTQPTPPVALTPETLAAIQSLAQDIPDLWLAPSTTNHDRKRLVRLFVREVQLTEVNPITFSIQIGWVGGATSQHTLFQPYGPARIVRQLRDRGMTPTDIAAELNRMGARTIYGHPFKKQQVKTIFRIDERGHSPRNPNPWRLRREPLRLVMEELCREKGLSDGEVAHELNRRGLVLPFVKDSQWTKSKVFRLRDAFGIPGKGHPDPQRERLRPVLTEVIESYTDDDEIAAELNRRGIRTLHGTGQWNAGGVAYLRSRLCMLKRRAPINVAGGTR
jgi:DNA invertase Pin-like site-specific DNA recombinase